MRCFQLRDSYVPVVFSRSYKQLLIFRGEKQVLSVAINEVIGDI